MAGNGSRSKDATAGAPVVGSGALEEGWKLDSREVPPSGPHVPNSGGSGAEHGQRQHAEKEGRSSINGRSGSLDSIEEEAPVDLPPLTTESYDEDPEVQKLALGSSQPPRRYLPSNFLKHFPFISAGYN